MEDHGRPQETRRDREETAWRQLGDQWECRGSQGDHLGDNLEPSGDSLGSRCEIIGRQLRDHCKTFSDHAGDHWDTNGWPQGEPLGVSFGDHCGEAGDVFFVEKIPETAIS